MRKFKIYWLHGTKSVVEGRDFEEAFNRSYSAGALRAVDWYEELKEVDNGSMQGLSN